MFEAARVGGVHISRIEVESQAIVGNLYYAEANVIMFVEAGRLRARFFQVHTGENVESQLAPGDGIIHIPAQVAFAFANTASIPATIVMFSDQSLRETEDHPFVLYKDSL